MRILVIPLDPGQPFDFITKADDAFVEDGMYEANGKYYKYNSGVLRETLSPEAQKLHDEMMERLRVKGLGKIFMTGTAGGMNPSAIEKMEELFYNPEAYKTKPYDGFEVHYFEMRGINIGEDPHLKIQHGGLGEGT